VKALRAVPLTYGFPELSAQALCEAGSAYQALEEHREARAAWQRVLREWPDSRWAAVARRHLAERK
jgi:TolA-binding protein